MMESMNFKIFVASFSNIAILSCLLGFPALAGASGSIWDSFLDPKDGKFDVSNYLIERKGFLPVPIITSDPAIGYGGGAALLFFHESEEDAAKQDDISGDDVLSLPPSVSFAAGFYTENESWAGAAGHSGSWKNDSIRYLGAAGGADLNLKYYGAGLSDSADSNPFSFSIKGLFLFQELTLRYKTSNFFLGGRYTFLSTDNKFDDGVQDIPGVSPDTIESKDGGLGLIARYDSRDNTLSPNSGMLNELIVSRFDSFFGSDFSYTQAAAKSLSWWQLLPKLNLGVRVDGRYTSGDAPFYALPYIDMRGIPALRYQGESVLVTEIEPRWDVTDRWSLVGFVGSGWTDSGSEGEQNYTGEIAGGGGFRYLIARRLGLRTGLDVAVGPEETVLYIAVGSGKW